MRENLLELFRKRQHSVRHFGFLLTRFVSVPEYPAARKEVEKKWMEIRKAAYGRAADDEIGEIKQNIKNAEDCIFRGFKVRQIIIMTIIVMGSRRKSSGREGEYSVPKVYRQA